MRRGPLWLRRSPFSQEGKSRNKVAVGEPAAGSPPKKKVWCSTLEWAKNAKPTETVILSQERIYHLFFHVVGTLEFDKKIRLLLCS